MRAKILLGILLPILLIITVTLFGSYDGGVLIKKSFIKDISYSEVFKKSYSNGAYRVGEIEITNDYFLPKRFQAPYFLSCKYDKEGIRPLTQAGYVFYNEGEFTLDAQTLDLAKVSSSEYYRPNYYSNNKNVNVEIGANKKKKLQIYFTSEYSYYGIQSSSDLEYDHLILVEVNDANRYCDSLTSEDLVNAIKINITAPINYCFDSDNTYNSENEDYYSLRNQYTILGTCKDKMGNNYTDYCLDPESLIDYTCQTSAQEFCGASSISCKNYGFNRCENGRCVI